jgi:hypothetical protein
MNMTPGQIIRHYRELMKLSQDEAGRCTLPFHRVPRSNGR